MDTSTEEREWPEPGGSSSSFWNPSGPFRPLRRIVTWLTGICIVAILLATLALSLLGGPNLLLALDAVLISTLPFLFFAWGVLWFIDTILAYLKS